MDLPTRLDRFLDASLLGYTRLGPVLRRRRWQPLPSGILEGRTAVVTGATSGIGRAAAVEMAALGAEVVVVGRNRKRGSEVTQEIAAAGGGRARLEIADLSVMAEVHDLADRLLDGTPALHVLVNNVGVLLPDRRVTAEGLEATLATNLLGHFVLTNRLMGRLEAPAPARIINVSSGGMYTQRIDTDDLQMETGYDGRKAYARTKRGQVILTEMWADRLAGTGVVVQAMHPGWAETPGVASGIPLFSRIMKPVLRTPEAAADTIVWLAASEEAAETSGLFWHDRVVRPTHRSRRTMETAEDRTRLWDALEELAKNTPD